MTREQRMAENEILFRQVNERILAIEAHKWHVDPIDFMCECADETCTHPVRLSTEEYERLRSDPARFAVLPGHEVEDIERVVETHPTYLVVEKLPPAREVAVEADPRA